MNQAASSEALSQRKPRQLPDTIFVNPPAVDRETLPEDSTLSSFWYVSFESGFWPPENLRSLHTSAIPAQRIESHTMDDLMDTRLTALETALSSLVDSISSYNPSVPVAQAILKADFDLQHGLNQLAQHQRNNRRITSLRDTITSQNQAIKVHLTSLVDVRKELLDIPTSLPQKDRREVSHEEVLAYAKRIARFTMPPGMKQPTIPVKAEEEAGGGEGRLGAEAGQSQPPPPPQEQPSEGRGIESLEEYEKQWLDPWTGVQFTPWPGEDVIKRGALGEIQAMVERGVDPATVATTDNGGSGAGHGEKGEEVDVDVDMGNDARRENGQAQQMTRTHKREEEPKVFGGLDLYDPDEEG